MLHSILLLAPAAAPLADSTWTSPLSEPVYVQDEAPAAADEASDDSLLDGWDGTVTINASQTYGNSDITTAGVNIDATREKKNADDTIDNRWTFGGAVNYSETTQGTGVAEVTTLQRRRSADLQYDQFLTDKSYVLAQAGIADDSEAALDGRWTVGLGYGFQVKDTEEWKISAEAGVSYVEEDYATTNTEDYTSLRIAYDVDWTGSEDWSFSHSGELFPAFENFGDADQDIYAKFDTRLKVTLTEAMFAQLQSLVDYDNTPAEDANGDELDRFDHLLLLSIGWSF